MKKTRKNKFSKLDREIQEAFFFSDQELEGIGFCRYSNVVSRKEMVWDAVMGSLVLILTGCVVLFLILGKVLPWGQKILSLGLWSVGIFLCFYFGLLVRFRDYGYAGIYFLTNQALLFVGPLKKVDYLPLETLELKDTYTWSSMYGFKLASGGVVLEIPFADMVIFKSVESRKSGDSEIKEFSSFFEKVLAKSPSLMASWRKRTNLSVQKYLEWYRQEHSI